MTRRWACLAAPALVGAIALGAACLVGPAAGAGSDLCLPVGKIPPGVTFPPGTKGPPGYVKLPPGIKLPGAVPCPTGKPAGGAKTKPKPKPTGKASFSGSVRGALPGAADGRAGVIAIRFPGGGVAAATRVGAGGHYALKVPAGTYALVTWIADLKRGAFSEVPSALVKASAGARRSLLLQTVLKKKKRKLAAASRPAGFGPPGWVTVPPPSGETWAVVDQFDDGTGDPQHVLGRSMQSMMITDLVQAANAAAGRKGCNVKVSALNYRIGDVISEIQRSESPNFDPGTRIPRGGWVEPNVEVRGTVSNDEAAGKATGTVEVFKNGKSVGTATRTTGDYLDLSPLLAKDVVNLLCPEPPPKAYTGALDGTATLATGPGESVTVTWKGTMELSMKGDGPGPGGGTWRMFGVDGGSVHVSIGGSQGDCSVSGSADVPFSLTDGQLSVGIDGKPYRYQPILTWAGQNVPITLSGSDSCKGSGDLPLSEGAWARLDSPASSDTFTLEGSADRTIRPGFTEHMHWAFTPHSTG
jgi:hypothetical protein